MSKPEEIIRWYDMLVNDRANFDRTAEDIKDYISPFSADVTTSTTPGSKRTNKIFDSTASYGGHVFSQFVQGAMVNPGNKWCGLRHKDEGVQAIPRVATKLEEFRDRMLSLMRNSFYGPVGQAINGWTFFGNGPMLIEEVPQKREGLNRIRYTAVPFGQYVMAEGDDGMIDKFIRCLLVPAHIAVTMGDVSDEIKKAAEKEPLKKFEILHSIMPRDMQAYAGNRKTKIQTNMEMPYASCWVEKDKKRLIRESGYRKFPVAVARYDLVSGETYGRGPAELALPDARSLNQADQKALLKWDRELDPPTLSRRNSIVGGILNKRAGGNTVVSGEPRNSIVPLFEGSNWQAHDKMAERKEQSILRVFHVNEIVNFVARERGPDMTAFEVNARLNLLQQIIGPVFNRLESEFLSVIIDVTLDIMAYAGLLGAPEDMPEELLDAGHQNAFNVIYEGPLSKAQRSDEILAIQQSLADVGGVQPFYPEAPILVDWKKAIRKLYEIRGTQDMLKDEEEATDDINKAREAANAQTALSVAGGTAEALGKVAPFVQATREDVGSGRAAA